MALLHQVIVDAARDRPDAVALVHGRDRLAFSELADRVTRAAAVARHLAPPGGRIAAIGPNHRSWVDLYHGVPASGRVLTFLNHRLSGPELAALVARSGARAVVGHPAHLARLDAAGVDLPVFDWEAWDSALAGLSPEPDRADIDAANPDVAVESDVAVEPDDPAWLLFTSGTTAAPKGAVLTHTSILAAVAASTAARPVPPDDVYLFPFPLCHVAGYNVVHRHAHRRPVVLVDGFEPVTFCAAVADEGVTSTSVAATMLASLLDHVDADPAALDQLATLRSVAYGAAPMAPSLMRRAVTTLGVELTQGYGMTELSGNAVFLDPGAHRRGLAGEEGLLRAAGRPAPGVELRIADEADEPVAAGEVGEVLVRAPQVMAAYWDDPDASAAALRGGWLHTGDLGRLDPDGLLYLVDRSKDIIITGGENVSSREVEDVLLTAAGVSRVAVVAVPDPTWGENVCAVVVPGPDGSFDADAMLETARAGLAGFKVPRHVVVVDDLPVNAAGKVVKAELRAWLAADPGRVGPRR